MGIFDFFKSNETKKPSIDLMDFTFLSDDHTRIENGRPTGADNKGAWRGIKVSTSDNVAFFVEMYNMDGNHPVWGNNIQMAEKRMRMVEENQEKIVLRGFGKDIMGASFADYGLTLHKSNNNVTSITLHMYDRNIDIVYKKAANKKQNDVASPYSDFDNFKNFVNKWNDSMPMQEKMQIAMVSDAINNKGAHAYQDDDMTAAISYFEQALVLMPNNDDALKNLKICYSEIGNPLKLNEVIRKLNYLG